MSNSLSSNIIFRDQCRHHLCSIDAPWAVEPFDVSFVPIFSLIDGVCHFQISLLANNHQNSWKFTQNNLLWLYWSYFECFFHQMSTDRFLGSIVVILSFISEMKNFLVFLIMKKQWWLIKNITARWWRHIFIIIVFTAQFAAFWWVIHGDILDLWIFWSSLIVSHRPCQCTDKEC